MPCKIVVLKENIYLYNGGIYFIMPTNKPRITIICEQDIYEKIEDFQFDNRYKNRSKAACDILNIGLNIVSNSIFEDINLLNKQHSKLTKNELIIKLLEIGIRHSDEL
jgi:hypothetical protein|nr:MAG TPA: hypothetical protein [Caudoviricetes sp.]